MIIIAGKKTESGEQTAQRPSPGDAARAARRRRNGEGNKGSFLTGHQFFGAGEGACLS